MARIARHYLNAGDRLPSLTIIVTLESTGLPIDFTNWVSCSFSMRREDEEAPTILDAVAAFGAPLTAGKLIYDWGTTDTGKPGKYFAVFQAVDASGRQASFPNDDGRIEIYILPRLDQ